MLEKVYVLFLSHTVSSVAGQKTLVLNQRQSRVEMRSFKDASVPEEWLTASLSISRQRVSGF